MRVLITGSRGQVGSCLKDRLPEDWELIATDSKTLDITNTDTVNTMVASFQPDVIINTAAYTNVNQAEQDKTFAFAINATGVKNLAQAAQKNHARLIHLSTDYVFDGEKDASYTAEDYPNPINVYGKSKLAGELLAMANCENTLIIRTSSIFSEYGINFVTKIIAQTQKQASINISTEGKARPTYAGDLAALIIQYIQEEPKRNGIVHFGGEEILSWYEFAKLILDIAQTGTELTHNISNAHQVMRPINSALQLSPSAKITHRPLREELKEIIAPLI